jgi:hypothetical protein
MITYKLHDLGDLHQRKQDPQVLQKSYIVAIESLYLEGGTLKSYQRPNIRNIPPSKWVVHRDLKLYNNIMVHKTRQKQKLRNK